jgi:hypothetical protein
MKNNTSRITPFPIINKKKKNDPSKLIMAEMSLCMIALVSLIGISELFVVGSYSIGKSHMNALHSLPIMY